MATFDKQRAFGQNFLKDEGVIRSIRDAAIESVKRHSGHALLEIGPGKGALTRPLLEHLPLEVPFHLAERDRELIEYWQGESRVKTLLRGDFLDQSDETLDALGPLVVVSNLPYSAGTAIVVKLAERSRQIPEMILMFQAEVARRLRADASTPDRGSLSLYIQNEWDVERLLLVPPEAFRPAPKVMSEVVHLTRRSVPRIPVANPEDRAAFNALLKSAFAHRRKMLRANLSGTTWQQALAKSGVDPTKRAEALEWDEWVALWQHR
jgi:16S rRNA (adenine1518-N6/adenine1519-N6)-dimethyltransferase